MSKRSGISLLLCFMVLLMFHSSVFAANAYPDIEKHWAGKTIRTWVDRGWIKGYEDGTFKPDNPIKRAEFVSLINRVFRLHETKDIAFKDVKSTDWFYKDLQIAAASGYISGYQDQTFRPNKTITREEIAVVVAKITKLTGSGTSLSFADNAKISSWSRSAVQALVEAKIVGGYKDNTFRPAAVATRAEAVVILEAAVSLEGAVYNLPGVYGGVPGIPVTLSENVKVTSSEVTLQNMTIKGNLTLAAEIGNGDVYLSNVTVEGTTIINGGGANSIHVQGASKLATVEVNKQSNDVRLVVEGATTVQKVILKSGAVLENKSAELGSVLLSDQIPEQTSIKLSGDFPEVEVRSKNNRVEVTEGKIGTFKVAESSEKVVIDLASNATIAELVANGAASFEGAGTIDKASIYASGLTFKKAPTAIEMTADTSITVGGKTVKAGDPGTKLIDPAAAVPGGSGGGFIPGGSGGGPGGSDQTPGGGQNGSDTLNATTVFPQSIAVKGGAAVTLSVAPASNTTAWFAPAGTTSFSVSATKTKLTGNGASKSILAPASEGTYKLFIVEGASTIKSTSTADLTVDNTAPQEQNAVFASSTTAKPGAEVTLSSAPAAGVAAWFVPTSTIPTTVEALVQGPSMTRLIGNGSATKINAPTAPGTYKLYLVDAVGNISAGSTNQLTVDGTAPSTQNTVFSAPQTVKPGAQVTLNAAPSAGEVAWFAPSNTSVFTEGASMTKLTGNGTNKAITAPALEGNYNLFIVDTAGNASAASTQVLTVDGTAPTGQNAVFATGNEIKGGTPITLNAAPADKITAWFAPSGTTSFTASNTMTSTTSGTISAPASEGTYKLFLVDAAGNSSVASNASLIVDNTAPTNQNTVFATNKMKKNGTIDLDAAPADGITAWIAPSGTTAFTAGASMTTLSGNGMNKTINVPTTDGVYVLYLIDKAGNVSSASTATLTVDNLAPTEQDTVFAASQSVSAGTTVTLDIAIPAGMTAWFAPAVTTIFTEDPATMTKSSNGTTILAPTTQATYKLFLIDNAGNVSLPSQATLTVGP